MLAELPTGFSSVIAALTQAVKSERVTTLASALAGLLKTGAFEDERLYVRPLRTRYARKLIWRDPGNRFEVVGMSWAPGQASPLHDHGGLWGGEIVVSGTMRETRYRLLERVDPTHY